MKAVRLLPLCVGLLVYLPVGARGDELPPAAREVLDVYDKDVAEVTKKYEQETKKINDDTLAELKLLQDRYCKDGKLDEAVAVRAEIRQMQGIATSIFPTDLPAAAQEVLTTHDRQLAEVQKKIDVDIKKVGKKALAELKTLQERYCKDGQLDEAVAVRDLRRGLSVGATNILPDPGAINSGEIGKAYYYQVVGSVQGSTWGTDIYTSGSSLAATAVHAGILRDGQKGVVKVTMLPGQNSYAATTRNGVTSSPYGPWGVSFKVERVLALDETAP